MEIEILCPGPSLTQTYKPSLLRCIAVNRAALWFDADWWAALDGPFVKEVRGSVKGSPKLFTKRENRIEAAAYFEDVYPFRNDAGSYYTTPAALALAVHLGATRIDVYGCDWAIDQPGLGGFEHIAADRSESRFAREREHFMEITDWLNVKGIEVTRYGIDG